MKINISNTALAVALLSSSGESFVTNPAQRGGLSSISLSPNNGRSVLSPTGSTAFGAVTRSSRVRRFATSNTNVMSPDSKNKDDEVQRLKAMAAKLRQEASTLEAEQKSLMSQAAERVFRKFDTDKNGEISVQELQQGLEKLFKMKLPEKRARQLIADFDINGDGTLQLDEFVGVDKLKNQLEALTRAERDLARQQAKQAQEEAQQAQLVEAQMELVNDKPPTASDKVLSVLPYLFPLLDGLQFARFLVEGNPDNPLAMAAVVSYALYRAIPLGGFLSFFALNFLSENPRINRLVRFNMQQAVWLDIALFTPALIAGLGFGLLNQLGVSIPPSVVELSNDGMFLALLAAVGYSAVSSLLGETPNKLPFVSKRVEDRMITRDMFNSDGRFTPFDKDGNLKKPGDDKDDKKD